MRRPQSYRRPADIDHDEHDEGPLFEVRPWARLRGPFRGEHGDLGAGPWGLFVVGAVLPALLVIGFSIWSFVTWQVNWAVVRGCACAVVASCATLATLFRRKR